MSADDAKIEKLTEIASALRSIIENSQTLNASSDVLDDLLGQTKTLEASFAKNSSERMISIFGIGPKTGVRKKPSNSQEWSMRLPYGPVTGPLNPIAPPVRIEYANSANKLANEPQQDIEADAESETKPEPEKLYGFATLGNVFEGPRNSVNGGTISAIYDHLLSFATMAFASPGPTAQLTIRYRAKTPLHQELRFETWVSKIDGRKIHTEGRCYAGDVLCSEATALFIKFEG